MGFGSPDFLHLFVEAKKLAFADRARFYADPAFAEVPVAGLISKEYAAPARALIDMARARRAASTPATRASAHGDTIYLTIADERAARWCR